MSETNTTTATAEIPAIPPAGLSRDRGNAPAAEAVKVDATPDRAKLEATIAEKLAAMNGDGDEAPGGEEEGKEVAAAVTQTADAATAKETPAEEVATTDDDGTEVAETTGTEAEGAAVTDTPTLPAAYVRSLKSDGWTDEEIASHAKSSDFVAIAGKIHDRRNAETAKWSQAGRAMQSQQPAQQQTQQQTAAPSVLKPIDPAPLKEQYSDDKLIDAIIGPVNAAIAEMNAMLPVVQNIQQQKQADEVNGLVRQINEFFNDKELEPYKELYGNEATLANNPVQLKARQDVLEQAQYTVMGAKQYGVTLTLREALLKAHEERSSGYKKQAVRTTITKELKQRNKGITLKSSTRSKTPTSPDKSRSGLESRVKTGLAKVFG